MTPRRAGPKIAPMPSRLLGRLLGRVSVALTAVAATAACNEGLQPTPLCPKSSPKICGIVTFQGTAPGNTDAVYIVAYQTFPQSKNDLFNFQPPLAELRKLPLDRASTAYSVAVPKGRYAWVLAAWVDTAFTLATADTTLREAGFYRDAVDPTQPGVVIVNDTATESIDFVIDFGNMHRMCEYFPPCP